MQVYNVDFKKLALLLLPTVLRKPIVFALLKSACKAFSSMQGELFRQREECNVRMTHTSQVCYLKAILNKTFCADTEASFNIVDVDNISGEWLMTYQEEHVEQYEHIIPVVSTTEATIVYTENAIHEISADFLVEIPSESGIVLDPDNDKSKQMRSIVEMYRLAGKRPIYSVNNVTNNN